MNEETVQDLKVEIITGGAEDFELVDRNGTGAFVTVISDGTV